MQSDMHGAGLYCALQLQSLQIFWEKR